MSAARKQHESMIDHLPDSALAALVIIGNEILSGRTEDRNIPFLAERLDNLGIQLAQVRIVPDIESDIVEAVNSLRKRYQYVFTVGGIGPTHDDITTISIARAFGRVMERNTDAMRRLRKHYKTDELNDARARMADMPRDVVLIDNPVSAAPGFIIENVYVMAGVPEIMQAMFDSFADSLQGGKPLKTKTLQTNLREGQIAVSLAKIQKNYHNVVIASYPYFKDGYVGVSLVLRSADDMALQRATNEVRKLLQAIQDHRIEAE
jgi:molybdenum cofactor synthesis domain-containing protein